MKEHMRHLKYGNFDSSAVANHAIFETPHSNKTRAKAHSINQEIELLEREPHYFRRKFKEALYIKHNSKTLMNLDTGWKINPIWTSLFEGHVGS